MRCSHQARLGPLQLEDEMVVPVPLQGLHGRLGVALLVVRHEREAPALHRLGVLRQVHPVCSYMFRETQTRTSGRARDENEAKGVHAR